MLRISALATGSAPDVSVIVAARNAEGSIAVVLDALERQTTARSSFETIVVDDGSEDGTAREAEARPRVTVLRAPGHVGLPAARNIGIGEASAPLLAFTDHDCAPEPDWIERGLARFAGDPDLSILACRVEIPLPADSSVAELLDAVRHFDSEAYVDHGFAAGGSMWARRQDVVRVGGLNERLAAYGHEDFELCRLLTSSGAKLVYAPEVALVHPPRTSLRQLASKCYRLGRGLAPLRRNARGPGPGRPLLLRPWHLLPNPRLRRMERLTRRGIEVGALLRIRLLAAQYLFCDLPYFAGDVVGTLRLGRW